MHGPEKKLEIVFESCQGAQCLSFEEKMTWFEENEPEMEVIYAHNFIDFFKFTDPLRRTITF